MTNVKSFLSKNAMLVILLLTILFFQVLLSITGKGALLSPASISNLIAQNSYVAILATGMLLCILTGGNIDLSVGSIVVLVGAFAGIFIVNWDMNPYIGMILCLLIGTAIGAWQGFWIAYMHIPPFIVTLAGMLSFRGLALMLLGSQGIGPFPEEYSALFTNYFPSDWIQGNPGMVLTASLIVAAIICIVIITLQFLSRIRKQKKGYATEKQPWVIVRLVAISAVILFIFWQLGQNNGVPVILLLLGIIVIAYTYFTQNTTYGRYLYAIGGNQKAARLSGVNTDSMMFFAYTNMGFLSGITALVCVARYNQATTTAGNGFELDAIGACFIGGASAYGGVGTVSGAIIGAIFMGVLNMGMSLIGWDVNVQRLIKGLVLLAAVVFDILSKNRKQAA